MKVELLMPQNYLKFTSESATEIFKLGKLSGKIKGCYDYCQPDSSKPMARSISVSIDDLLEAILK